MRIRIHIPRYWVEGRSTPRLRSHRLLRLPITFGSNKLDTLYSLRRLEYQLIIHTAAHHTILEAFPIRAMQQILRAIFCVSVRQLR